MKTLLSSQGVNHARPKLLTPNGVSLLGALLSIIGGLMLLLGLPLLLGGCFYALGCIMDTVDGRYARAFPDTSKPKWFGPFVDSVCDKVGEVTFALCLLVVIQDSQTLRFFGAAVILGLFSSQLKSDSEAKGLPIKWPEVRYFGRASRAVLVAAILVFGGLVTNTEQSTLRLLALSLLSHNSLTCLERFARLCVLISRTSR